MVISSGGVVLPGLRASGCLVLPVSRRHASWGRWWIVSGMGGRREPWAWLALLGCVVRASAFVMSGFSCFGAVGLGLFPHYTKSHPVYSPPRLLSCCCIVHGLYNLLVCVCVCLRASGFVGSWDRARRVVCAVRGHGGHGGHGGAGAKRGKTRAADATTKERVAPPTCPT